MTSALEDNTPFEEPPPVNMTGILSWETLKAYGLEYPHREEDTAEAEAEEEDDEESGEAEDEDLRILYPDISLFSDSISAP